MLIQYLDVILLFLAGAFITYVGRNCYRLGIGDKLPPEYRERLARSFRRGGPLLVAGAVLLALMKALLSG